MITTREMRNAGRIIDTIVRSGISIINSGKYYDKNNIVNFDISKERRLEIRKSLIELAI